MFFASSSVLLDARISPNTEERTEGLVELLRWPRFRDDEDEDKYCETKNDLTYIARNSTESTDTAIQSTVKL